MPPDVPAFVPATPPNGDHGTSAPLERATHVKRSLSLDLLLAFAKMYGVIDDYSADGGTVIIRRLGARYRVEAAQARELLLRMLRERPPLADLAFSMCFDAAGATPLREEDPAGA